MNTKLVYPVQCVHLPDHLRQPIRSPPDWSAESDLAYFRNWKRPGPFWEGEDPRPPQGLTCAEAFTYLDRILASGHTEMLTAFAAAVSFERKQFDATGVHLLRQLPLGTLVELYARECELAIHCGWDILDYCEQHVQAVLHAELQFQHLILRHTRTPGSVNLYELCRLIVLVSRVALNICEYHWYAEGFEAFFESVMEGLPAVDFRSTYGIKR